MDVGHFDYVKPRKQRREGSVEAQNKCAYGVEVPFSLDVLLLRNGYLET